MYADPRGKHSRDQFLSLHAVLQGTPPLHATTDKAGHTAVETVVQGPGSCSVAVCRPTESCDVGQKLDLVPTLRRGTPQRRRANARSSCDSTREGTSFVVGSYDEAPLVSETLQPSVRKRECRHIQGSN